MNSHKCMIIALEFSIDSNKTIKGNITKTRNSIWVLYQCNRNEAMKGVAIKINNKKGS